MHLLQRPAAPHLLKGLDLFLFLSTLAAIGISFWEQAPEWVNPLVLMLFVLLFALRAGLDSDRQQFLKSNWLDLMFVVLLASPFLRLLAAAKLIGLVPALRIGALVRANRERLLKLLLISSESFPVAMSLLFGVVFIFGLSSFLLEHAHNPAFGDLSDAMWWAFATLSTVGYGDIYPVTAGGRVVGVMTMIFGMAVYSLLIANLTRIVDEASRRQQGAGEE